MINKPFSLCCALMTSLSFNLAAETKWSVSADIGSVSGEGKSAVQNELDNLPTYQLDDYDDRRSGFRFNGSYHLNQFFSVDAGWLSLGDVDFSVSGQSLTPEQDAETLRLIHPSSGAGPYIGVTFNQPISKHLSVATQLAMWSWEDEQSIKIDEQHYVTYDNSDEDIFVNVSLNAHFDENHTLYAGARFIDTDAADKPVLHVGFKYSL